MDVTGGKKVFICNDSDAGQTGGELALSLDAITIEQGPCGSKPKDSEIEIKQQEALESGNVEGAWSVYTD